MRTRGYTGSHRRKKGEHIRMMMRYEAIGNNVSLGWGEKLPRVLISVLKLYNMYDRVMNYPYTRASPLNDL